MQVTMAVDHPALARPLAEQRQVAVKILLGTLTQSAVQATVEDLTAQRIRLVKIGKGECPQSICRPPGLLRGTIQSNLAVEICDPGRDRPDVRPRHRILLQHDIHHPIGREPCHQDSIVDNLSAMIVTEAHASRPFVERHDTKIGVRTEPRVEPHFILADLLALRKTGEIYKW